MPVREYSDAEITLMTLLRDEPAAGESWDDVLDRMQTDPVAIWNEMIAQTQVANEEIIDRLTAFQVVMPDGPIPTDAKRFKLPGVSVSGPCPCCGRQIQISLEDQFEYVLMNAENTVYGLVCTTCQDNEAEHPSFDDPGQFDIEVYLSFGITAAV